MGRQYEDEDPFVHLDGQDELQSLVDQISHTETCCEVDDYINGEDDMPVCMEYDNDWEDNFFAGLNLNSDTSLPEDPSLQENPNEEEEEFDLEPPPQKITKYQDAIAALEDSFDSKGHFEGVTKLSSTMSILTNVLAFTIGRPHL